MTTIRAGRRRRVLSPKSPHIVIVIANIPVDRDRRVCRQAEALTRAGATVSVICPRDSSVAPVVPGLEEVRVFSFRRLHEGTGPVGFAVEFLWALLAAARRLLRVERHLRMDVVQFCNPPDVFFPLMLVLRAAGRRAVFDHHDLSPEIYEAKGVPTRPLLRALLLRMERWSLRSADAVISTNESFREVATLRGGISPENVVVVRNGPWIQEIAETPPTDLPQEDRVVYLGVTGRQDGVDRFVRACALLHEMVPDARFDVIGDGEMMPLLRALSEELGLNGTMTFHGWLSGKQVHQVLAGAAVAVQPDPRNVMSEKSTMAKTVEYLAHGLPVVAVDLVETRRTAADAAVYVGKAEPRLLAEAVAGLLADPQRRAALGRAGAARVRESLAWDHQALEYVTLYRRWHPQLATSWLETGQMTGGAA